ncbi:LytR/AlgR family response regulator transcription factor [Faecalibacter sp. LW9]|uniref:LytR/AlgR family response regulator transcription factor n=1 Tax=Faecalibacter sp. LW9 TaxID=3103144 RepID=UPI002AFF24AC|nr:response regulator [Faecalibacter sp. LW9]
MFKALIIVDEFPAQEGLNKLIHHSKLELFKEILVASSVNEGVELIREHQPELMFLDINMLNEYGVKLFDYFDKISFDVIFTTAHSDYIMDSINNWGCLGYLIKPISILELKNVLHRFK